MPQNQLFSCTKRHISLYLSETIGFPFKSWDTYSITACFAHEIRQMRLKTLHFVCQELGKTNTSYHYLSFCSILSVSSVYFDYTTLLWALLCYAQFFSFFLNAKQPAEEDYSGRRALLWRVCSLHLKAFPAQNQLS